MVACYLERNNIGSYSNDTDEKKYSNDIQNKNKLPLINFNIFKVVGKRVAEINPIKVNGDNTSMHY